MYNEADIQKLAEELVRLEQQKKTIAAKIKQIKAEIKDYTDVENVNDRAWMVDNGCVEVITKTRTKLVDVPAEFKVPIDVAAVDIAEKAFKFKISLTKEGKQMLYENHPSITKLVEKTLKKIIKVTVS